MHSIASSLTSPHRLARLLAWARLMLAWIGAMLFSANPPRPARRHIRRRYRLLALDRMARLVGCLILIRAGALARLPRPANRAARDCAPAGFRKRTRPRHALRSAKGARLRASLRHRDLRTRLALLVAALADLDASARPVAARLARRLTRLFPIVFSEGPPAAAILSAPLPEPGAPDTS